MGNPRFYLWIMAASPAGFGCRAAAAANIRLSSRADIVEFFAGGRVRGDGDIGGVC